MPDHRNQQEQHLQRIREGTPEAYRDGYPHAVADLRALHAWARVQIEQVNWKPQLK